MFLYALEILPDRIHVCDVPASSGLAHGTLCVLRTPHPCSDHCAWWVLAVLDLCWGPHSNLFLSRKLQQEVLIYLSILINTLFFSYGGKHNGISFCVVKTEWNPLVSFFFLFFFKGTLNFQDRLIWDLKGGPGPIWTCRCFQCVLAAGQAICG